MLLPVPWSAPVPVTVPVPANVPAPSRFAKLPAFPDAQRLAAAAAAEGSGHSRDAVERAREIAGPLDRPVEYDAVDRPNLVLFVLDDASRGRLDPAGAASRGPGGD